jgi:hypothetical protein
MNSNKIELRPYNLKELAHLYKVDNRTFKKWVSLFKDKLGERQGNFYTIPQVKIIFQHLGLPGYLEEVV